MDSHLESESAQLLPKEEFKPAQPTPNFPKGGTTFTESAYKTVSSNTQTCGKFEIKSHYDFEPVESSEPAESAYKEFEKLTPLHDMQVAMGQIVESSEPQENIFDLPKDVVFDLQRIALADDEMSAGFGAGVEYRLIARSILNKHRKPVSAPSESQEEMWWSIIKRAKESYHFSSTSGNEMAHFIMEMKSLFTITRNP